MFGQVADRGLPQHQHLVEELMEKTEREGGRLLTQTILTHNLLFQRISELNISRHETDLGAGCRKFGAGRYIRCLLPRQTSVLHNHKTYYDTFPSRLQLNLNLQHCKLHAYDASPSINIRMHQMVYVQQLILMSSVSLSVIVCSDMSLLWCQGISSMTGSSSTTPAVSVSCSSSH